MVRGPRLALASHALKARGVRASSRVDGERLELDAVERHLTGDALALGHGVHLEYGPPLPPGAALRRSSPRWTRCAAWETWRKPPRG